MATYKRSNEIATLAVAILFFMIATVGSAKSALHGWVGLLFFPTYVIGFITVLTTSIFILVRDPYFRFKMFLLPVAFLFMMSSFLIVGDNGDTSGSYYQGKEYSSYSYADEGMEPLPKIVRTFSGVGFIAFFVTGIVSMGFMVTFAASKKREIYSDKKL